MKRSKKKEEGATTGTVILQIVPCCFGIVTLDEGNSGSVAESAVSGLIEECEIYIITYFICTHTRIYIFLSNCICTRTCDILLSMVSISSYHILCVVLLPKSHHQCFLEQPQGDDSLLEMYCLTSTETFVSYKSVDHDGSCFQSLKVSLVVCLADLQG